MSDTQEFTLVLTLAEIQTAAAAIGKLPWDVANPLMAKVSQQVSAQMPKKPEPAAKAERPRRPTPPPVAAEPDAEVDEYEDDGVEAAPPVSQRRVVDEPPPLPRRPVRGNGAAVVEPALAAEALSEPVRGRA